MAAKKKAKEQPPLPKDLAVQMYQQMCLFRRFEERVGTAYTKRKFSGFCHLHIGQEALAVGVQATIKPTDYMLSGYRSHTQAIGKGISPDAVMAELFGKATGCAGGKGGSMHMFSAEHRFYGGHGIVGGQVPLAAGIAFSIRYNKTDDVCVCYMGDAATNQGAFHEALNMAATWDLPALFIIENNKYGMGTDINRTTSIENLWQRALSYDMDHSDVDGMNVVATYNHTKEIIANMRKTKRPHLLEAKTYRYRGHSVSDPGTYRTKEEVKNFQENHDPIKQMGKYLVAQKYATETELKTWDKEAKQRAADAEDVATAAPEPKPEGAMDHVLTETNEA